MDTKNRIKELMDGRGWTIYELSKRSRLAQTTISNMWKRNTEPTIPSLRALCYGFGIPLAQFFAEGEMVELTPEQRYFHPLDSTIHRAEREADESGKFNEVIICNQRRKGREHHFMQCSLPDLFWFEP